MYEQVRYEVSDPIATITMNRPDRLNAWTERMGRELKHAFAQAENDRRVVAIILTGEGRGFCSGADLQGLSALAGGGAFSASQGGALEADPGDPEMGPSFRGAYTYPMSVRKPVIAAVNGPCAGLGMPIALACDLRFASDRAMFTTAFARRGLIAEWGISWMLPRLVGTAHAMDLLLSARKVEAAEAERIGLVNRVVKHDELLEFTQAYATDMAEHCAPGSLAVIKRQVYEHWIASLADAEQDAIKRMLESFGRPDFGEGVQSFLERRPPRFGRIGS